MCCWCTQSAQNFELHLKLSFYLNGPHVNDGLAVRWDCNQICSIIKIIRTLIPKDIGCIRVIGQYNVYNCGILNIACRTNTQAGVDQRQKMLPFSKESFVKPHYGLTAS